MNLNPPHAGKPFTTRHKFMKGLCKRAGVPYFPLNNLRPYVASQLMEAKQNLKEIQEQLRHGSMTTTIRYVLPLRPSSPGNAKALYEQRQEGLKKMMAEQARAGVIPGSNSRGTLSENEQ